MKGAKRGLAHPARFAIISGGVVAPWKKKERPEKIVTLRLTKNIRHQAKKTHRFPCQLDNVALDEGTLLHDIVVVHSDGIEALRRRDELEE